MDRNCDGCTKCCEGHLTANIYGYEVYPGKPCHFVSKKGCSIYLSRPYDPCKGFKCVWKQNPVVPNQFKPDIIGIIMTNNYLEDTPYIFLAPAGKDVTVDILDWAITAVNDGSIKNIVYQKDNKIKIISQDSVFIDRYKAHLAGKKNIG
jgi:hypothetical protein